MTKILRSSLTIPVIVIFILLASLAWLVTRDKVAQTEQHLFNNSNFNNTNFNDSGSSQLQPVFDTEYEDIKRSKDPATSPPISPPTSGQGSTPAPPASSIDPPVITPQLEDDLIYPYDPPPFCNNASQGSRCIPYDCIKQPCIPPPRD